MTTVAAKPPTRLRQRVYEILEAPVQTTRVGWVVNHGLVLLIVLSIAAAILESVPDISRAYATPLRLIEIASLIAFSAEYVARIWIAPEHMPNRRVSALAACRSYVFSPQGVVDFLAVAPLWVALFGFDDLRIAIILRVLRVLKFARYSSGLRSLLEVLASERRALIACLVILLCATVVAATAMHLAEGRTQPEKFGTIPDAMWWAIVTLSTIGYGDVVPVTGAGKVIASFTIIGGLIMIALPVGIVANAFAEVIHRRDFIVTFGMVARVPLFSHLGAADIAHVMQLLQARQMQRGEVVFRRGEPAHSMYLIAEGEVEIELGRRGRRVRLGPGHFFGENAVIKRVERSATVRTVSRARLLVLDADDLRTLIAREPGIAEKIATVSHGRQRGEPQPEVIETDRDL